MEKEKLHITFLGTGTSSGVPMIACHCKVCKSINQKDKRLRSSILIQSAETTVVIDTTPDFRYQMLRIGNEKLDAVLITHAHKDHTGGLDDVRAYNYFQKKEMQVFATEATQAALKCEYHYAFEEVKYPGVPQIILNTISDKPFYVNELKVMPIKVWHHYMPVVGFRLDDFTYITDANKIDDNQKELIKGSKILVLNALRKEKHISHFTLNEAIALVDELQIPCAYFTHISHQMGLHEEVEKELPTHIHLAYDGLTLEI